MKVEIMEKLLSNPDNITFSLLFVGLLIWVMKTNAERENNYRNTIDKLSTALVAYEDIKEKIDDIHDKVNNNG